MCFITGCIASSKHVKKLDKIVEAQAHQSEMIVDVLVSKDLLTLEQADLLTKNAKTIVEEAEKQTKETASIFTWKTFSWSGFFLVLDKLGKLAKDFPIGGWAGIAIGTLGTIATWVVKNKQNIKDLAENDLWHTNDKVKVLATALTPKENTEIYDKNKTLASQIVAEHESKDV